MIANKNVTIIPAYKQLQYQKENDVKVKTRVAGYCRVSTDSEEQASSYDSLHRFYK